MPLWRVLHHQRLEHAQESGHHARALRRVVTCTAHGGRRAARRGTAMEYIFTLKYQLGSDVEDMDAVIERLGEAGCDDALAGIGLPGRLALEFARGAQRRGRGRQRAGRCTPRLARRPADRGCAGPGRPDRRGRDRRRVGEAMRKLMLAYPGSFRCRCMKAPRPWHLADLLEWLRARATPPGRPRWRKWRGPPCRSTWPERRRASA